MVRLREYSAHANSQLAPNSSNQSTSLFQASLPSGSSSYAHLAALKPQSSRKNLSLFPKPCLPTDSLTINDLDLYIQCASLSEPFTNQKVAWRNYTAPPDTFV
jgi:hypothetical protein